MALCHEERDFAMGFSRYDPHAARRARDLRYDQLRRGIHACRAAAAKYRRLALALPEDDPQRDTFEKLADVNAERAAQAERGFRSW